MEVSATAEAVQAEWDDLSPEQRAMFLDVAIEKGPAHAESP